MRRSLKLLGVGMTICIALSAQTLKSLANFPVNYNGTGLLTQGLNGDFYASTAGAFYGPLAIFQVTPGGTSTKYYDFGAGFEGTGVVQAGDGNLYTALITPTYGGPVYRITPAGVATVIHTFPSDTSEGFSTTPLILGSDGNLYGTNAMGGVADGGGTIFKLTLSGNITLLFQPTELTPGSFPGPLVQGKDGNFYFTGSNGGTQPGAVLQMTPSGEVTLLHTFTGGSDGGQPTTTPLVQGSDGAFYGTTSTGGANNAGTIYKVTSSGSFTLLYTFPAGTSNISGLAQAPDGSFYGTTFQGLNDNGSVFRLSTGGTLTTVYLFNGSDGYGPAGLITGQDGNLYGLTYGGGSLGGGVVYELALGTGNALPAIAAGGVISASGFGAFSSIAPGTFIEIYGSNLAPDTRGWAGADFTGNTAPTSLDGTSVSIAGVPAYVNYISPGQVNALVPSTVPAGPQTLTVTTAAGTSIASTINVNSVEPGLLAPVNFNLSGTQYAVALFADGTYVLPTGAISGITSRPAKPGDIIVMYGVGFGPVTPNIPAGQLVGEANTLADSFTIDIGGLPATVEYDGLAPSFTGLYQFNIEVPKVAPGNAVPLTFSVNGLPGTQTLYLAIGN